MRKTVHTFYLLMIILQISAFGQTKQSGEKQPQRFEGLLNPTMIMTDGRIIPLFIDITIPEFPPADPQKADPDEILKSVSAEGSELKKWLEFAKIGYEFGAPTISFRGKEVNVFTGYTLVMVYPEKGTTGEGLLKNPATFSPGALTDLKQVINRFGEPPGKQIWSGDLTRLIGLDGLVYWWGEIGVSASNDDKITHVLLRHSIKKK